MSSKPKSAKKIKEEKLAKIHEQYPPKFVHYTYEDYENDLRNGKLFYIEPMSAKSPLNEKTLEEMLHSTRYYAEEKFDGVRGDLQFHDLVRSFTRSISKVTNWWGENTDLMPQIRDMKYPKHLKGTVLDGEYRILDGDFKDIVSLLGCNYDEAILRQIEGNIRPTFIAFDIIYYEGVSVTKLPLKKRRELLEKVVKELDNESIILSKYTVDKMYVQITDQHLSLLSDQSLDEMFPQLANEVYCNNGRIPSKDTPFWILLSKQAWYEYILLNGGEGMMLKDSEAQYHYKRGREYTKYKKFGTWDLVLIGFVPPTREYEGKDESTWTYWENDKTGEIIDLNVTKAISPSRENGYTPVTKNYAKGWIGNLLLAVIIDDLELEKWKKQNPKDKPEIFKHNGKNLLVVSDCGGINEETREYMTNNQNELIFSVIEVKGHELIKKTGRVRHPRFVRFRPDKTWTDCIWSDYIDQ